jgi:hypothetical protein
LAHDPLDRAQDALHLLLQHEQLHVPLQCMREGQLVQDACARVAGVVDHDDPRVRLVAAQLRALTMLPPDDRSRDGQAVELLRAAEGSPSTSDRAQVAQQGFLKA